MQRKFFALASLLIIASMILGACATPTAAPQQGAQVTTVVETVEVMVEGETKIVTATPEPAAPAAEIKSADPTTLVVATIGEPETVDPALNYETAGGEIIANVYESLIFYNREKAAEFVPALAMEVPSAENGGISADGKTYTFNIRQGVKFHNGADMTPSDVAFSFQRGILQGSSASPQWLYTEAFFGIGVMDVSALVNAARVLGPQGITNTVELTPEELQQITDVLAAPLTAEQATQVDDTLHAETPTVVSIEDDSVGIQDVHPAILQAVCERVKSAVVADDAAGTITMNLAQPWGPMIPTLAASWGSVMDQDWVAENGGWDGDCATWQNYYAITSENSPFTTIANGTGPFKLDHWTQGEEVVMVANEDYWRTEPMWEGGPSGAPVIKRVVIKKVDEWGTRFAMLQAGDADFAVVPRQNVAQVDPLVGELCNYVAESDSFDCQVQSEQPLSLFQGAGQTTRTDVFFTFEIANPDGSNSFLGSGQLDGNGIPTNFFSDVHVRRAFNYCFDWETYIQDALVGEAVQSVGIPMPGMPGYDPEGPKYTFDPDKCAEEFQAAELRGPNGETVWDNGFRMQVAYNTGNTTRQTIAEIMAQTLSEVNEKFQIEIIGLPWPAFLRAQRAESLPLFVTGWQEDIHDPHNWYVPYLTGTYGQRQNLPTDITSEFQGYLDRGVAESDPAARDAIYKELNQKVFDLASIIILATPTIRHYEQRWVEGWYYNPIYPGNYYYSLSKQ